MSIIDEYIEIDKKYKQLYGYETVILMEVGDFFELYGVQNDFEQAGANLQDISDILNIRVTAKNKSIGTVDRKNPLMSGFPSYIVEKHIQTLVENQYTVVLVEQYENKNCKYYKQFDRKVSKIITPSTYFNYQTESLNYSNYLMICYWETIKQNNKDCLSLGCSLVDISTGNTYFYECIDKEPSSTLTLEEVYRIYQMYNPTEVIHTSFSTFDKSYQKKIIEYLHSNSNTKIIEKWNIDTMYKKIRYQEECIKKSYSKYISFISPIDTLKMEMKPMAIISLCYMLQYVYEHDEKLLNNLLLPEEIQRHKHMSIEYNSIQQLNIKNQNNREKCLSKILNRCLTSFGKRKFWDWLINPIIDENELNKRYNNNDYFIKNNLYITIRKHLNYLCDIQKYLRKICIEKISPNEWSTLLISFENILLIYNIIQENNSNLENSNTDSLFEVSIYKENCNELLQYINNTLNIEECGKYSNLNEVKSNIFNYGINTELDKLELSINNHILFFNKITEFIDNISNEKDICKLEYNDKLGYSFVITKKRWENFLELFNQYNIMKEKRLNTDSMVDFTVFEYNNKNNKNNKKERQEKEKEKVNITKIKKLPTFLQTKIYDDIDFDFSKIIAKPVSTSSNSVRLTSTVIEEISNKIINEQQQMKKLVSIEYLKYLKNVIEKHEDKYLNIIRCVSEIDIYCTNSINSIEYSYNKPQIINSEYSFIIANDIRHPIVERIQTQNKYVVNDVSIGIIPDNLKSLSENSFNGILLYGVNSSGKSTLMKSIGLNVIMAQAGMYVPCSKFTYSPYKHIFTRISGNDNIYKGMSSFTVEMTELKNILDRCNKNSLILGDELCSGTESISALAIVASGIMEILSKNGNFIFATHLHELCDLDVIKNVETLNKIQVFHIHVDNDKDGNIIFDRKLTKGKGSSIYGLEICKYLKLPDNFLKNAEKIRKQLMDIPTNLIEPKSSKYNSNLIVSSCGICGYIPNNGVPLDTHHIVYQHTQDENGFVKIDNMNLHKNQEHNLIPLCKKCHNEEHNGILNIKGYIETSNGRKIIFDNNKETKKEKETKETKDKDFIDLKKIISFENDKWKFRKTVRSKWNYVDQNHIEDYLFNNNIKYTLYDLK
jgi:DNA mismatch repair protein MutS